jgi:hypothetical protein
MSYATATTVISLLPILPQTSTSSGYTATTSLVTSHISRADNIINGKIVKRYDISGFDTTGSVPPILISLSEDITSYFTMRSYFSSDNQNENEWVDKFLLAKETLDMLREGDMDLFDTAGSLIPERETDLGDGLVVSSTEEYQSFFDEDEPINWKVDDDKLTSIRDAR